jgi:hypothetical protein
MSKLSFAFGCVSVLFLLWFLLSWCDVVTDNLKENPQHSKYNIFVVWVDVMEGEQ